MLVNKSSTWSIWFRCLIDWSFRSISVYSRHGDARGWRATTHVLRYDISSVRYCGACLNTYIDGKHAWLGDIYVIHASMRNSEFSWRWTPNHEWNKHAAGSRQARHIRHSIGRCRWASDWQNLYWLVLWGLRLKGVAGNFWSLYWFP